jgi:hypothetical protein
VNSRFDISNPLSWIQPDKANLEARINSTLRTWSLGPGQNTMALPAKEVQGFSVQVSVLLFFFPDT